MTTSDRPRLSLLHHPVYRVLPAVRAALRRSVLAVALGCAVPAMAVQATQAAAAGPDVVARGNIVFMPNGSSGMVMCSGGITNYGTLGVVATFGVSCPAVQGSWNCSASGGASCLSVLGPSGTTYLPPGASIGVHGASNAQPGFHSVSVTGSAQDDVDTSNNVSTRCVSAASVPRPAADLSTIVRYPRHANFGDVVEYEVDVENHGSTDIPFGAQSKLRVNFSGLLREPRSASCTALTAGAQCGSTIVAAHDGAYFPIGLPVGGRVTLRLSGTIPVDVGLEEYTFVNTDFSCLPTIDTNTSNEQGPVKTKLTLFHDEFELPSTTVTE